MQPRFPTSGKRRAEEAVLPSPVVMLPAGRPDGASPASLSLAPPFPEHSTWCSRPFPCPCWLRREEAAAKW